MLGYGAIFFNNSLSVYYILVVVRGWKNHQLLPVRKWLFSAPVIAAFILAFAGIPYYSEDWVGCWIEPHPYTAENWIYFFGAMPVFLTTTFSTIAQIRVYFAVRAQLRKSSKWNINTVASGRQKHFSSSSSRAIDMSGKFSSSMHQASSMAPDGQWADKSTLSSANTAGRVGASCPRYFGVLCSDGAEATVFWQSFFYLAAYYICWLTLLLGIFRGGSQSFAFWCLLVTVAPLQGFFNALVYFRPRVMKYRREWLKKRRRQQKAKAQQKASASTNMTKPPPKHSNVISIPSTVPSSSSCYLDSVAEKGSRLGDDVERILDQPLKVEADEVDKKAMDEVGELPEENDDEGDAEPSLSEKFPSLI